MAETRDTTVQARRVGQAAIIYASDYLNKLSGERIERECRRQLESGFRTLIINFRDTELVNSIGVSILVGVIDAAEQSTAQLIFADLNDHTVNLFQMLGLTRTVQIARDESEALSWIERKETSSRTLTADTRG